MGLFVNRNHPLAGVNNEAMNGNHVSAMSEMQRQFLLRAHPPARLKASEAADLLGFHEDDMAILVRDGLIKALGKPSANAIRYFALSDVVELGQSSERLSEATEAVYSKNRLKAQRSCAHAPRNLFIRICQRQSDISFK